MAVKLSNALNLSKDEFREVNVQNNLKLREALKNPKFKYSPVLPKPDIVYTKDFHFLSMTLAEKESLREQKRKKEKKEEDPKEEAKHHKSDEKEKGVSDKELNSAVASTTINNFKNTSKK